VFSIILTIHIALSLFMILVILIQQGKGADAGVAFGAAKNTNYAVSSGTHVLSKITTGCALLFMATSILLVKYYPLHSSELGAVVQTEKSDGLAGSVMTIPEETDSATTLKVEPEVVPAAPVAEEAAAPVAEAPKTEEKK